MSVADVRVMVVKLFFTKWTFCSWTCHQDWYPSSVLPSSIQKAWLPFLENPVDLTISAVLSSGAWRTVMLGLQQYVWTHFRFAQVHRTLPAAAATKSLQSCPTLCDPIDSSPTGSAIAGILQARTLEWVASSFSSAWKWKVKVKSLSRVLLLATPWTAAYQAPPSMGFSRQEYWSGVPLPSPRTLPNLVLILNIFHVSSGVLDWSLRPETHSSIISFVTIRL